MRADTSIPENFDFHLYIVASETPYLRHKSAVETPDCASFNTAMICSSVYRLRAIGQLLFGH
jgi:hypothetical protein